MARVICPFCLKPHDFVASLMCPVHNEMVPAPYVKDYHNVPPLWLVTVGFSEHGKTTYLAALTLTLQNIDKVWPSVFYRQLDQYTIDEIRKINAEAKVGKPPEKTVDEGSRRPLLFSVFRLPEGGSRCLVMYDVRGEVYNSLEAVKKYVTPIKEVSTIWFLVSLADLEQDTNGKTINELFNVYLTGMQHLRADLKDRNLIVVFTKGDKKHSDFPKEISQYLRDDPLKDLTRDDFQTMDIPEFSLQEYIERMRLISDHLRSYTRHNVRGGTAFINMVEDSGMNLVFCVTSALGGDPNPTTGRMEQEPQRSRVLDPFLWAVILDKPSSQPPINLLVDVSGPSQLIFEDGVMPKLGDRLLDFGDLTAYYLGQAVPVTLPGQSLPGSPPRTVHHRLIGPILEQLPAGARTIIVATGPIIDLDDFFETSWRNRLLLVLVGEVADQKWPHKVFYGSGDDPSRWIDQLFNIQ